VRAPSQPSWGSFATVSALEIGTNLRCICKAWRASFSFVGGSTDSVDFPHCSLPSKYCWKLLDFGPLDADLTRFDITNSAVQDIQPQLSYPAEMLDWPAKLEELPSNLIHLLARLESTDFNLVCLGDGLRQTAQLASYVNSHAQQPQFWKAGVKATKLVGPAAHSVLFVPRLDLLSYLDDDGSCLVLLLQEIVRFALLILLATLKRNFSLIADELGLFLERFSVITPLMLGYSFFPELRLWAYPVAACARADTIPQRCQRYGELWEICKSRKVRMQ
jgi:hypothetical protein